MNDIALYIALGIIVSLFCYRWVYKILGSFGIFLSGMGIMYAGRDTNDTWMGLIILMIGLIMLLGSLFEKPSSR